MSRNKCVFCWESLGNFSLSKTSKIQAIYFKDEDNGTIALVGYGHKECNIEFREF